MSFDEISKWLEEHYILVFVVLPGVIAHVMPHLSPEMQQKLGVVGKVFNALSGNYKHAANSKAAQTAIAVAAAVEDARKADSESKPK